MAVDTSPPFSVAWTSDRLYRATADHGPYGREVELDGWSTSLDAAWRQLVDEVPEVVAWVTAYLDSRDDQHLTITFGDTRRVVGRRGHGGFGVSYPSDLLLSGDDQVSAMRAAILVALDRHVDACDLQVPLLSSIVSGD